jgi:hypothetical protein
MIIFCVAWWIIGYILSILTSMVRKEEITLTAIFAFILFACVGPCMLIFFIINLPIWKKLDKTVIWKPKNKEDGQI